MELALIGCGGMGLRHAYGYIELRKYFDSFHMGAVCDLHEEAANHVASVIEEATGDRPTVYTDLDRMLEEHRLDAVDIVTDTRMHHVFAGKAFEAGVNVMTEKPMGLTIRACQKMRSDAQRAGKILSIAENYRRDPLNRLARELLNAGAIGQVNFMIKLGVGGGSELPHDTGWRALKLRAGSMIIEQGVHDADLMMFFLGDIESIYARTGLFTKVRRRAGMNPRLAQFYSHRVEDEFAGQQTVELDQEDTAFALVQFASGAIGEWALSTASHGHRVGNDTTHGSLGTMIMPRSRSGVGAEIRLEGRDEPLSGEEMLALVPDWELDDVTAAFWDGQRRMTSYDYPFDATDRKIIGIEYQELAECIESGRQPEVDALTGMKPVAFSYATLESGISGQPVRMSDMLEGSIETYQREVNDAAGL